MNHNDNDTVPILDDRVKWTKLFHIKFILGIIGAAILDFPKNIVELT